MKSKFLVSTVGVAVVFFACQTKNNVEEPQPQEKVYDGSITYISNYDNPSDTGGNAPEYSSVIALCNINILSQEAVTEVHSRDAQGNMMFYAMDANIAAGQSLKVTLRSENVGFNWGYLYMPFGTNWHIDWGQIDAFVQDLTVQQAGVPSHLWMTFSPGYDIRVEMYKNGGTEPNRVKLLKVIYDGDNPYIPQDSTFVEPQDSSLMFSPN